MSEGLLEGHLEVCFYNLPAGPVQVTMSKSMGCIIADCRLPLALRQNLKLHRKLPDSSPGNPVLSTYAYVDIQLALILDISQRCCLLSRSERLGGVFFSFPTSPLSNKAKGSKGKS